MMVGGSAARRLGGSEPVLLRGNWHKSKQP